MEDEKVTSYNKLIEEEKDLLEDSNCPVSVSNLAKKAYKLGLKDAINSIDDKPLIVESSNLESIAYIPSVNELLVTFTGGAVYVYSKVTITTYAEFVVADSYGKHFNEFIKGKFEFKKL